MDVLHLNGKREAVWRRVAELIEGHLQTVEKSPVAPLASVAEVRAFCESFDFERPLDPVQAVETTTEALRRYLVHTTHPGYFGLFNPAATPMGIAADALVAAFNPQLAVWAHAPFAVEIERHLVRCLGTRFGYDADSADGIFTSGGSEANHTAMLTALTHQFPQLADRGVRALDGDPVFYLSSEGHHSFAKAARLCGLGADALQSIPVDTDLRMDVAALRAQISTDRRAGRQPFLIVATGGTTNAGVVDPLEAVAGVAAEEKLWLHVDAAWGGAAVLAPNLRPALTGIERADSITFDAHKWLSVPMGAGVYLTRHPDILGRTFHISAAYVPRETGGLAVDTPLARSMFWSRRFIGLKVFLSLAVAGWEGYRKVIQHMAAMGDLLREKLEETGWRMANRTPLPVICFFDATRPDGKQAAYLEAVMRAVVESGQAWISTTRIGPGMPVLRACITHYRTGPEHIAQLVDALDTARKTVSAVSAT